MATITTRPPQTPTLDINSFTEEEKLAMLAIFGNIRLVSGSPVKSIVKKLEQFFTDDDFESAFEEFNLLVYFDGSLMDPGYVELELKAK